MPRQLVSLLVAEGASVDAITNRLTIFNALERVKTQGFPAGMGRLMVVVVYEHDEAEEFWERIQMLGPDGGQVGNGESKAHIVMRDPAESGSYAHRSLHALWRLHLPVAGEYRVVLESSDHEDGPWEIVSSRRILVVREAYPFFGRDEAPKESDDDERDPPLSAAGE